ncbi:MAG: ABC transporter permease [Microthrixaceae bacterium]
MTFLGLIFHNLAARRLRSALTAAAVAIGVMAVLALGVLTSSLRETATQILNIGKADFTIAQRHTDDIINGTIGQSDIDRIGKLPGVEQAIGALIELDHYDAEHPGIIQVGLAPDAQEAFGVTLLKGRVYDANSPQEVMLGYQLADSVKKAVGDTMTFGDHSYQVVGLYRTDVDFGNNTMMFPLTTLQGLNRKTGQVTLGFVKVRQKGRIQQVAKEIDDEYPQLTTIRTVSDYGRADRNLTLIEAANTGGSILAGLIAITGVLNTALLSFFERVREFGLMRAIGWSRRRVLALVLGETLVVSIVGAMFGVLLGWVAINLLQDLQQLRGIFVPTYNAMVFTRALVFATVVAFLGALYPAIRAASLAPMEALRRE